MGRIIIAILICTMALSACGQNAVVNRWLVAGQLNGGKLDLVNKKSREYEFLKGNKFNMYEGGTIKETGTYSFASDKKSLLLKIDDERIPIKIIKLNSTEFSFVVDVTRSKKDTLICYASSSSAAAKAKQKTATYNDVKASWSNLTQSYSHRLGLFENLYQVVKDASVAESEIFTRASATTREVSAFQVNPNNLTKDKVKEYDSLQSKVTKGIFDVVEYAKGIQKLRESALYANTITSLTEVDKRIETYRTQFFETFKSYTGQ